MKLKDGFVLRSVAGVNVALSVGTPEQADRMISLNSTGCFLWKLLSVGAEESELVAALMDKYEISEEVATKSVQSFVTRLQEFDLIV